MLRNAAFLLSSDVANRAATFVLYALVARYRGATEMGQLAIALSLFYAFQVLAAAGLRTVITREVSRDRTRLGSYLTAGGAVVLSASALAVLLLAGFTRIMGYSDSTASIVLVIGAGLLPYALSAICEALFQAAGATRYIAYAQVPVALAKVLVAGSLLMYGSGIYEVAVLLLACQTAVVMVEGWFLLRYVTRPEPPAKAGASVLVLARSGVTLLGVDCLIAMNATLNAVLLSVLATETQVGLYSAATQLMVPVALVYQSTVLSVFPTICQRFATGAEGVAEILHRIAAILLAFALPMAVALFFLAESVLLLLYGDLDFISAAGALRIVAWTLVPAALTAVLGQVLLATRREKVTLRIVAVDLVVGLAAGLLLVSQYGLAGAAIAAAITRLVDVWQHYASVGRLVERISLPVLGWKPVLAAGCMAVYLHAADGADLIRVAVSAGALYGAVLLSLMLSTVGGPWQLKARYVRVRADWELLWKAP